MRELRYSIDLRCSAQRYIAVTLEVSADQFAADFPGELFLPTWTAGSYLIREFSRHLSQPVARDAVTGTPLRCWKSSKNRFRVDLPTTTATVVIDYRVYAHELTVRTADCTSAHSFWNHACLLLWPVGRSDLRVAIRVQHPPDWELACALPIARLGPTEAAIEAPNQEAILDVPCLAGRLSRLELDVRGVRHSLVFDGLGPVAPPDRLRRDVAGIVEAAADVFAAPLPYPHYTFLCLFTNRGHGGLEHGESSTLLAARTDFSPGSAYDEWLGLLAHELFHAWNVKRMRPAEFWSYDYEVENYTPMLWLAEGFTAYYDDLLCRRAGVRSVDSYLGALAKNLNNLWSGHGRFRQSLSEASFDAWIRLYRPDENTRNSTQNYYGNGAVAAMVLDLTIRQLTDGARSLDNAMQHLWRETWLAGRGYTRGDVECALAAAAGCELTSLLRSLVDGPLDPDVRTLLANFGVDVVPVARQGIYLGLSLENKGTVVSSVAEGGPAYEAGLSPGDEILALDGLRVSQEDWSEVVESVARADRALRVLVATRGLVEERSLIPTEPPIAKVSLQLMTDMGEGAARRRRDWLHLAPGV